MRASSGPTERKVIAFPIHYLPCWPPRTKVHRRSFSRTSNWPPPDRHQSAVPLRQLYQPTPQSPAGEHCESVPYGLLGGRGRAPTNTRNCAATGPTHACATDIGCGHRAFVPIAGARTTTEVLPKLQLWWPMTGISCEISAPSTCVWTAERHKAVACGHTWLSNWWPQRWPCG